MPAWRAMASKTATWAAAAVSTISTHLCLRLDGAYPQELPPLGYLDLEQVLVEVCRLCTVLQSPAMGSASTALPEVAGEGVALVDRSLRASAVRVWEVASSRHPNQGKHARCNQGAGTSRDSRVDSNTGISLVGPNTCWSRPGSMLPKRQSGVGACMCACVPLGLAHAGCFRVTNGEAKFQASSA